MIYESAYVLRPEAGEEAVKVVTEFVAATIKEFNGEILLDDNWGVKTFAQPTTNGVTKGQYIYVMYKADTKVNLELERRFKISEDVLKFIFINLGVEADQEAIVKGYKNPAHAIEEAGVDSDKERRMFSKKKSCWFSAKKTTPDWKDTSSYSWLVNEFGKISPARVTGLRPKHQRAATTAIKRGRCMGLISYMSGRVAR
jgi:small subunit ribosomal protein S6